jgi:ABC-2 type transport system permease protein
MSSPRFFLRLFWVAIRARAQYRADFVIGATTAVLAQLSALAFYWIVFTNVPSLGGWSAPGVLFLFGMTAVVHSLSELFFNGIWLLPMYVIEGDLDRVLLYPVHNLTFLLMARPEVHAFGNLLSGSLVLGAAFYLTPPPAVAYFLLPLWLASGALVYTAALVLLGCTSFFLLGPSAHHLMLGAHLLNASRYPVSIYPKALQYLLLVALPLCVSAFLPGRWLQGRGSLLEAMVAPPLAAAVSVALAAFAFDRSVARYQSTGS